MRQVRKLKFGNGYQQIKIYQVDGDRVSLADVEYTNQYGVLRWTPPSAGTFNLICEISPDRSVIGLIVTNTEGFADTFDCPIS